MVNKRIFIASVNSVFPIFSKGFHSFVIVGMNISPYIPVNAIVFLIVNFVMLIRIALNNAKFIVGVFCLNVWANKVNDFLI